MLRRIGIQKQKIQGKNNHERKKDTVEGAKESSARCGASNVYVPNSVRSKCMKQRMI